MISQISKLSIGLVFLSFSFLISCASQTKNQEKETLKTPQEQDKDLGSQLGEYIIETFEDSKGNLWFGTLTNGVAMYDGDQLKYFTSEDGLSGNRVSCMVEDTKGNLWIGTMEGLCKYDGKTFEKFNTSDGLIDNIVSNLLIDKSGTLWIGTWAGVSTYDGIEFQDFPLPKPDIEIPDYQDTTDWLTEIMEDSEGNIWFARDGYGACKYDGKVFSYFNKRDGLAANTLRDIQEDHEGNIWFSSRVTEKDHPDPDKRSGPGGLVKYDGESYTSFPDLAGLSESDVYQIYRDSKDNIWVGTLHHGIYKYDGKSFKNYAIVLEGETDSKPVVSVLEDSKGNIWIGCVDGLFRLNSEGVVNITTKGPWE